MTLYYGSVEHARVKTQGADWPADRRFYRVADAEHILESATKQSQQMTQSFKRICLLYFVRALNSFATSAAGPLNHMTKFNINLRSQIRPSEACTNGEQNIDHSFNILIPHQDPFFFMVARVSSLPLVRLPRTPQFHQLAGYSARQIHFVSTFSTSGMKSSISGSSLGIAGFQEGGSSARCLKQEAEWLRNFPIVWSYTKLVT